MRRRALFAHAWAEKKSRHLLSPFVREAPWDRRGLETAASLSEEMKCTECC